MISSKVSNASVSSSILTNAVDGSNSFTGLAAAVIAFPNGIVDALETTPADSSADMYVSHVRTRVYDNQTYKPIINDIAWNTTRNAGVYWYVPMLGSE